MIFAKKWDVEIVKIAVLVIRVMIAKTTTGLQKTARRMEGVQIWEVMTLMTLDEAIRHCEEVADNCAVAECEMEHRQLATWLKELKQRRTEQRWIPIKWHYCTDEDREKYGFSNDIVAVFDNEMPDDNQEILITTSHGYVEKDVCYIDEGFSLDSGCNWIDDVKAWMPLPEPYREEK